MKKTRVWKRKRKSVFWIPSGGMANICTTCHQLSTFGRWLLEFCLGTLNWFASLSNRSQGNIGKKRKPILALECLETRITPASPTLSVHMVPPLANENNGQSASVGHMWYSIDDGNGNTTTYSFGPATPRTPFTNGVVTRSNDTNDGFPASTVTSETIPISQSQYNTLQAFGNAGVSVTNQGTGTVTGPNGVAFGTDYDFLDNNCVDYTWAALATIGIDNPINGGSGPTELLPIENDMVVQTAFSLFSQSGASRRNFANSSLRCQRQSHFNYRGG